MENEILVSVQLLEEYLRPARLHPAVVVQQGPDPEARIIGVAWRPEQYSIALIYDRPVKEPVFKELKQKLAITT